MNDIAKALRSLPKDSTNVIYLPGFYRPPVTQSLVFPVDGMGMTATGFGKSALIDWRLKQYSVITAEDLKSLI
ncbi:MAG TPA: hypothetical protein DCZ12_07185 [Gammaproteobacteria bacterium]|nr:hypothetical protein [Gammaproteobacteria bacterium]